MDDLSSNPTSSSEMDGSSSPSGSEVEEASGEVEQEADEDELEQARKRARIVVDEKEEALERELEKKDSVNMDKFVEGDVSSDEEDGSSLDDSDVLREDAGSEIVSNDVGNVTISDLRKSMADYEKRGVPSKKRRQPDDDTLRFWQSVCGEDFSNWMMRKHEDRGTQNMALVHNFFNTLSMMIMQHMDPNSATAVIESANKYMAQMPNGEPDEERIIPMPTRGGAASIASLCTNKQAVAAARLNKIAERRLLVSVGLMNRKDLLPRRIKTFHFHFLASLIFNNCAYTCTSEYTTAGAKCAGVGIRCVLSGMPVRPGDKVYRFVVPTSPLCSVNMSRKFAAECEAHGIIPRSTLDLFQDKSGVDVESGAHPVTRVFYALAMLKPHEMTKDDFKHGVCDWVRVHASSPEKRKASEISELFGSGSTSEEGARNGTVEATLAPKTSTPGGIISGRVLVVVPERGAKQALPAWRRQLYAYDNRHAKYDVSVEMHAAKLVLKLDAHWVLLANERAARLLENNIARPDNAQRIPLGEITSTEKVPTKRDEWVHFFSDLCSASSPVSETMAHMIAVYVNRAYRDKIREMINTGRPTASFCELLVLLRRWFVPLDSPLDHIDFPQAVLSHTNTMSTMDSVGSNKMYEMAVWSGSILSGDRHRHTTLERMHTSAVPFSDLHGVCRPVELRYNEMPLNVGTAASYRPVARFVEVVVSHLDQCVLEHIGCTGVASEEDEKKAAEVLQGLTKKMTMTHKHMFYTEETYPGPTKDGKYAAEYFGFAVPVFNSLFPLAFVHV